MPQKKKKNVFLAIHDSQGLEKLPVEIKWRLITLYRDLK